jgi:predicted permease
MLEGLVGDVRLGIRAVRRAPGFTTAAVIVLALGIGANTTVFSALKMAVLSPLPYPDADRLVMFDLTFQRAGEGAARPSVWSYAKFTALVETADRPADPVAGYAQRNATLSEPGDPALLPVELVSPGYFSLLGMDPVLGRAFGPDEGDAGDPRLVAVLSYGSWRSRFGGDPDVVGRTVTLNGKRLDVVGVAPPGFEGLTGGATLWVPMASAAELFNRFMITGTQAHWLHVVGRLRDDVTLDRARAQAASIGDAIAERFPLEDAKNVYGADVRALSDVRVNEGARAAVLLLSLAAALVLLVACANLSGLLLARAKRRARDGAVRLAVGASRWRLVRGSLVESGVLAALGGGVGVLVALWGTRAMAAAWPARFLRSGGDEMRVTDPASLTLDADVLGYALLITALTALLFGVVPALRASRGDLVGRLKEGGGSTRRGRRVLGLDTRGALVGAQVALALVLLVGAALLGRSTQRLLDVDLGFHAPELLTFGYSIPRTSAWADDAAAFHARFLERVAALPGVEDASVGTAPLSGHWSITLVQDVPGRPAIPQGEGPPIGIHLVGDEYFRTLGVPVLAGRALDARDGVGREAHLVLSETAARRIFGEEDPVGRRIEVGISADDKDAHAVVVGVVGDVRYNRPDEEVLPEAYYSVREFGDRTVTVLVRTTGEPRAALPAVRAELAALDPDLPIFSVSTGDDLVAAAAGDRRIVLALLTLFALVTVLLAATGTWGIVAYAVAERRRELGLRMALGAESGRLVGIVLGRSVVVAVMGVGVGLAGAWAASRLLSTFLFETSTIDPLAYAGGATLLLAIVVLASWLPARRATRVDPCEALRAE